MGVSRALLLSLELYTGLPSVLACAFFAIYCMSHEVCHAVSYGKIYIMSRPSQLHHLLIFGSIKCSVCKKPG